MYCDNCGAKIEDDALFCDSCGCKVGEDSVVENQHDFQQHDITEKKEEKKTSKIINVTINSILITISILVVAVTGIVNYQMNVNANHRLEIGRIMDNIESDSTAYILDEGNFLPTTFVDVKSNIICSEVKGAQLENAFLDTYCNKCDDASKLYFHQLNLSNLMKDKEDVINLRYSDYRVWGDWPIAKYVSENAEVNIRDEGSYSILYDENLRDGGTRHVRTQYLNTEDSISIVQTVSDDDYHGKVRVKYSVVIPNRKFEVATNTDGSSRCVIVYDLNNKIMAVNPEIMLADAADLSEKDYFYFDATELYKEYYFQKKQEISAKDNLYRAAKEKDAIRKKIKSQYKGMLTYKKSVASVYPSEDFYRYDKKKFKWEEL